MRIVDGTGHSYGWRIGPTNRGDTHSVTVSEVAFHSQNGLTYGVSSGLVTLTSANKSSLLYILNNEDDDLVVENIIPSFGLSTGGSGHWLIEVKKNVTTGTLISGAVAGNTANLNLGSSRALAGTVYSGVEGSTATNGTVLFNLPLPPLSRTVLGPQVGVVIPKGSNIVISLTPPTGNTSVVANIGVVFYVSSIFPRLNS